MNEPIILAQSISKYKNKKKIFSNVNINLEKNESLSIIGKSGSGKSTLLNLLGLIENPTEGSLKIFNRDTNKLSTKNKRNIYRNDIGFIFQDYGLIYEQSVIKNLLNSLYFSHLSTYEKELKIDDILTKFKLENLKNLKVEILSGGEQQRVALMKLVLKKPKLILADEPTGSLDDINKEIVIETLINLCIQGSSLVLATHDMELANLTTKMLSLDGYTK